ncbi:peroxidase-like [Schistocerca nitens]|uniref:peroxidase-like n=1 Tax=Schistocerca nitens TaxID=7011 RepID=UPI0021180171|nr:peroxidase-like [Schistocerca nitens]
MDPVYERYNVRCMEFVRAMTVPPDDCVLQPAVPMNVVTAHLDLSPVYDNSDTANRRLREGRRGRLAVKKFWTGEFLPLTPNSPAPCNSRNPSQDVCFMAGDVRANQNPLMTATHVLYLREHNRIAESLSVINPHWDDERIYQESRRIAIACYQHITYEEMLPLFIGLEAFQKYFQSYAYDEELCPGTYVEFTSVCFRYFHTLVHGILKIMTEERKTIKELFLSEYFNAPSIIIKKFEELLIGAVTHSSRKEDENFDREIADELFRPNRTTFGMSLPDIDIQRARDHGVPPYNDLRDKCGLPRANDFGDLIDTTPYPF